MSSQKKSLRKLSRQYAYAEWKRRMLIRKLYTLIAELEGRPVERYSSGPFGSLERAIQKRLVAMEVKYLRRMWAWMRSRK